MYRCFHGRISKTRSICQYPRKVKSSPVGSCKVSPQTIAIGPRPIYPLIAPPLTCSSDNWILAMRLGCPNCNSMSYCSFSWCERKSQWCLIHINSRYQEWWGYLGWNPNSFPTWNIRGRICHSSSQIGIFGKILLSKVARRVGSKKKEKSNLMEDACHC